MNPNQQDSLQSEILRSLLRGVFNRGPIVALSDDLNKVRGGDELHGLLEIRQYVTHDIVGDLMGMDEADSLATVLGDLDEVCNLLPYEIRFLDVVDEYISLRKGQLEQAG